MKKVLAFDFGASSGRAILGIYEEGNLQLEEIHRFPNYPLERERMLFWDIEYLFQQVVYAIKKAQESHQLDSIGVDTWGVDFGMLDENGELLSLPRSYRDPRTQGAVSQVAEQIDLTTLYQATGNQMLEINTIFQLHVTKLTEPELFKKTDKILFMPDLFNYLLTGEMFAERSIASTGQMINPKTEEWATEILEALEIPSEILPKLVDAPHQVGVTKSGLALGEIPVINVCEHDTASAVISVPSQQKFLFVSCGTWSLVGSELPQPIINESAYKYELTNEAGFRGTTRFLKNLTGLWIVQELQRNLKEQGCDYSFGELAELANASEAFQCWIDTDHPLFSTPGNMADRIQFFAKKTGQFVPSTDGELVRCVYESLAMKYKRTFMEITEAVQEEFDIVNVVGGGSQAKLLCQMIADASNLRVEAGPVEATAIGNIAIQLMAQGEFQSIQEIRQWIQRFSETSYYFPTNDYKQWERRYSDYQAILAVAEVERIASEYQEIVHSEEV